MLIHVDKLYIEKQKTGKGKFSARLVQAWHDMGIPITDDPEIRADISYHVGRIHCHSKAKKHVLRVGPACIDTNKDWKKINRDKARAVKRADAIVYQSKYSRKIYRKLVCKLDKPETVILNGANPKDYEVEPYESNFKYNFLASARVWTKQKRLKDIIKSFLFADIPDSYLVVNGDTCGVERKYQDLNNVLFLGPVNSEVLARLYRLATAMIHIVWVDACPNSVVEAQVAGCPVICTDQGGTKELLRLGMVLPDVSFPYKAVNMNKPPQIDRGALANAMKDVIARKIQIEPTVDLNVGVIAKQYLEFFEEILA